MDAQKSNDQQKGLLETAIEYHEKGDYKKSLQFLREAANLKHPIAIYLLAVSIREGWGESPDAQKSVTLLKDCVNIIISDLESQHERPVSSQVMQHAKKMSRRPSDLDIASLHSQGMRASASSKKISKDPIKISPDPAKTADLVVKKSSVELLGNDKPQLTLSDTIERRQREEPGADVEKSGTILRAIMNVKIEEAPKIGILSKISSIHKRSGSGTKQEAISKSNITKPEKADSPEKVSPFNPNPPSQELKNKTEAKISALNAEPKEINEFLRSILSLPLLDLGYSYLFGWGVDSVPALAVYYFDLAALLGDPDAQLQLGYMFEHGLRIKKDKKQSAKYYRMYSGEIPQLSWIWKDKYNIKFENVNDYEIISKLKNVPKFEAKKSIFWRFCCCK